MTSQTNVVILAAGLTLIEHVVHTAVAIAPPGNATVVVGHQSDQVRALLAPSGVRFVDQAEQKGTGHALLACRASLASEPGLVVVLYGDCPLLSPATLTELVRRQASQGQA